ncbi:MAG: hypothetical protein ACRCXZ_06685 [Patescibacteria group bacterium]
MLEYLNRWISTRTKRSQNQDIITSLNQIKKALSHSIYIVELKSTTKTIHFESDNNSEVIDGFYFDKSLEILDSHSNLPVNTIFDWSYSSHFVGWAARFNKFYISAYTWHSGANHGVFFSNIGELGLKLEVLYSHLDVINADDNLLYINIIEGPK